MDPAACVLLAAGMMGRILNPFTLCWEEINSAAEGLEFVLTLARLRYGLCPVSRDTNAHDVLFCGAPLIKISSFRCSQDEEIRTTRRQIPHAVEERRGLPPVGKH